MGIIQSLNFDNKETKAVKQKIRELQNHFLYEFCEITPGAYCSSSMLNAAFISYLRMLNSPDINKLMRYNCDLLDMDNYVHIKTFKYNYSIGSPMVYVNIRLKSFPMSNQETT